MRRGIDFRDKRPFRIPSWNNSWLGWRIRSLFVVERMVPREENGEDWGVGWVWLVLQSLSSLRLLPFTLFYIKFPFLGVFSIGFGFWEGAGSMQVSPKIDSSWKKKNEWFQTKQKKAVQKIIFTY